MFFLKIPVPNPGIGDILKMLSKSGLFCCARKTTFVRKMTTYACSLAKKICESKMKTIIIVEVCPGTRFFRKGKIV